MIIPLLTEKVAMECVNEESNIQDDLLNMCCVANNYQVSAYIANRFAGNIKSNLIEEIPKNLFLARLNSQHFIVPLCA